jgi:hypothetical protein
MTLHPKVVVDGPSLFSLPFCGTPFLMLDAKGGENESREVLERGENERDEKEKMKREKYLKMAVFGLRGSQEDK